MSSLEMVHFEGETEVLGELCMLGPPYAVGLTWYIRNAKIQLDLQVLGNFYPTRHILCVILVFWDNESVISPK